MTQWRDWEAVRYAAREAAAALLGATADAIVKRRADLLGLDEAAALAAPCHVFEEHRAALRDEASC